MFLEGVFKESSWKVASRIVELFFLQNWNKFVDELLVGHITFDLINLMFLVICKLIFWCHIIIYEKLIFPNLYKIDFN